MVEAQFADISTDFTCLSVVWEFTKFLLYRKQQIPFSYDKMFTAVKRKQIVDKDVNIRTLRMGPSYKIFQAAEKCVDSLEEIFSKTSTEFSFDQISVSEVVLLFGGSILTPRQVYRLHFPQFELGHLPKHHSDKLIMSEVLKVIIESDELHAMFDKPLPPTSLFLLLRIRGKPHSNDWFIPKPRYDIPTMGQHVNMYLKFRTPDQAACTCKGFRFFSDVSLDNISTTQIDVEPTLSDDSQIWYQAPLAIKGFTDSFFNNVSVSKDWLT